MSRKRFPDAVNILLRRGEPLTPEEWKRVAARVAWTRKTVARLRQAQRQVNAAWDRIFAALPDDISDEELEAMDLPAPPEQAIVDALHAELRAVIDKDFWPKELYWGGL